MNINQNSNGLSGLVNLGNTCYINSVISCLSNNLHMTKHFLDLEKGIKQNKSTKYNDLLICYIILIRELWRENSIIKPSTFKKAINYNLSKYNNKNQHDASEFLLDFLGVLHESISTNYIKVIPENCSIHYRQSVKNWKSNLSKKSFITENFYGQYRKCFTCNVCDQSFYTYDPFNMINLPIPKNNLTSYSVDYLLNRYFDTDYTNVICKNDCNEDYKPENDTEDVGYQNPEHKIQTFLTKLPETLVLCLNRYNGNNTKNKSQVSIDLELNLDKFYITNSEESVKYTFKSAIYHDGDKLDNGHYYSLIKRQNSYKIFDDTKVFSIEDISLLDQSCVYILFYELKKN